MSERKILLIIGYGSFASWLIYFLVYSHKYTNEEMVQGMTFISIIIPIYFVLLKLYTSLENGRKIVSVILFLTGFILLAWIFYLLELATLIL